MAHSTYPKVPPNGWRTAATPLSAAGQGRIRDQSNIRKRFVSSPTTIDTVVSHAPLGAQCTMEIRASVYYVCMWRMGVPRMTVTWNDQSVRGVSSVSVIVVATHHASAVRRAEAAAVYVDQVVHLHGNMRQRSVTHLQYKQRTTDTVISVVHLPRTRYVVLLLYRLRS